MGHEWAAAIAHLADEAPSSDQSSGVLIALIGAVGLLVSVTVPALINMYSNRRSQRAAPPPALPLNSDSVIDGHASVEAQHTAALESFLMRLHFDPNLIVTGRERFDDVHFD